MEKVTFEEVKTYIKQRSSLASQLSGVRLTPVYILTKSSLGVLALKTPSLTREHMARMLAAVAALVASAASRGWKGPQFMGAPLVCEKPRRPSGGNSCCS